MAYQLKSRNDSYEVDYAIKGPDFIQGFKDGVKVCEYIGIQDFDHYSFDSEFRLPEEQVNEMIGERDARIDNSELALLDLYERVLRLEDQFERSLIDASLGATNSTSRAYAVQIMKGNISRDSVPVRFASEVDSFLRSL